MVKQFWNKEPVNIRSLQYSQFVPSFVHWCIKTILAACEKNPFYADQDILNCSSPLSTLHCLLKYEWTLVCLVVECSGLKEPVWLWTTSLSSHSSKLQSFSALFSQLKSFPDISSPFQHIPDFSSFIPSYSSLFQPTPSNSSLISVYSSLWGFFL